MRAMETMLVVPTFNEKENIEALLDEILNLKKKCHIAVVDDESPDGTGQIVDQYARKYQEIHPLHRKGKRGRGLAGIAGFCYALDKGAEKIIEMDADFSHHPRYIPQIIEALDDYPVVFGSRFVKGGRDARPGAFRRAVSRAANAYTRIVLGTNVRDCTSGYRGYRAETLESIKVRNISTWGPGVLSDVLYRLILKGYEIKEIPIIFEDRTKGESTLTTKILLEGLYNVLKVKLSVNESDIK